MGLKKKNLLGKETAVPFPTASGAVRSKPKTSDPYRVALLIPMCGTAGMWGPSCIASAEVALKELNAHDGIKDRPVEIVVLDSAVEADTPIELVIADKIKHGNIDAMVGMHISAVRQKIAQTVRGKIPFVYTPLYEGGEMSPGVFTIGDTPARQLAPAIGHMSQKFRLKKWALIGNDYVWPRVSHAFAKIELHRHQIEMVYENYLPFSSDRLADAVENIGNSGADAILLSLVGQ
ncbi:MAG: ABC transporter substrate-binding protein, partial [Lentilitoribacter sp.]